MGRLLWLLVGGMLAFAGADELAKRLGEPEKPTAIECRDLDPAAWAGRLVLLSGCGPMYLSEPPIELSELWGRNKVKVGETYYSPIRPQPDASTPAVLVARIDDPDERRFFEAVFRADAARQEKALFDARGALRWRPRTYRARITYPASLRLPEGHGWKLAAKYALVDPVEERPPTAGWIIALLLVGGLLSVFLAARSLWRNLRAAIARARRKDVPIRKFPKIPEPELLPVQKVGKSSWRYSITPRAAPEPPRRASELSPGRRLGCHALYLASRVLYVVASLLQVGGRAAGRHIPYVGFVEELFEPIQVFARELDRARRRMLTVGVERALAIDPRPPVLLLRSFEDDGRPGDGEGTTFSDGFATFEEELVRTLSRRGPVIAIGRPGEEAPLSGAAREYVSHDAWKARVEQRMTAAQLVVLVMGDTPGLGWELAKVRAAGHLGKLLLVVPNVSNREARRRLAILCSALDAADGFADVLHASLRDETLLFAFEDGRPRAYVGSDRKGRFYEAALEAAMARIGPASTPPALPAVHAR